MLSKVKNGIFGNVIASVDSQTCHTSAGNFVTIIPGQPSKAGIYKAIGEVKKTGGNTSYLNFGPMGDIEKYITNEEREKFELMATYPLNSYYNFGARMGGNSDYIYVRNVKLIYAIIDCTNSSFIDGIPKGVFSIGEQGIITIFGLLDDGSRKQAPSSSEFSSTASTGSITPGNYVGYVTIEAKDGKIYKVGVYNT